tara:strand:- start:171 stop:500 length:330 start_codon:yes stop_codon:yes gene_type:complete
MEFINGELVVFNVKAGVHYTEEGFTTILSQGTHLFLPEEIDLFSYPSSHDFKGKITKVNCGDIGIIIDYIGRPLQMSKDPEWFSYDVYKIYINGNYCNCFKHNLRRIKD